MGDLSEHFSTHEFRCKGEGQSGHESHPTPVSPHLVEHLEELRALTGGKPCRIVSGYRCEDWNQRVGGVAYSQHVNGTAADLELGYATVVEAEEAGFTGIGSSGPWAIHVDVRERAARWWY